jgi:membrane-bound lytic murein transglycosylase B
MSQTRQGCKLQWTTLAAIGKVESDHGRGGGAQLDQQGRSKPAIIGPALNGAPGLQKITDTDAGALDGDRTWDRAVGSMQFLPATWRMYAVDADNDQLADPFDLDDAALAAAYYLCAAGKDLTVVADWKAVVLTYNNVGAYLDKIFETAQGYGTRSRA